MKSSSFSHPSNGVSQQSLFKDQDVRKKLGVIEDKPTYLQYASLQRRIDSFEKWPKSKKQKPKKMAEAGFAYTGVGDAVRCFSCGNGLQNWEADNCPWKQHALHFRECAHLRQCKGDDYIREIHGENSLEIDGDLGDDQATCVRKCIEHNLVAVLAAKEFETNEKVEEAVKHFVKRGIDIFKAIDLMKAIEEIDTGVNSAKTQDKLNNKETKLMVDDEQENKSLIDNMTCKICFDARACIITIPCGHMVTCPQCIGPLKHCSMCRSPIQGTVRAFMSDGK